jgi:cobalt-zinc-cadmium resistance protein CzcA
MVVGFIGLRWLGYSANVMSLGAIDFGIIVEGAVVTVEHAMTHSAAFGERQAREQAIVHAMQDVARPALFTVVIVLLTFLPLATLEDVEGKMFRPVVCSLCFMLLGAMIYAAVLLPAVGPYVLGASTPSIEPLFVRGARRLYRPALRGVLAYPKATLGIASLATVALLSTGAGLGADFLPRIFEGALAIDALRPPSTSLTQAIALATETERALKETAEVVTVVNRIGRPEGAVDPAGPESSDVFVILRPKDQWRKGLTEAALIDELAERVNARVPATINAFTQPIEMRVNDLIAGVKSDVAIKLYGDDLAMLSELAEKVRRAVMHVRGATDVKVEVPFGLPAVRVVVDRDRMARLGILSGDVLDVVAMSRAGVRVGEVREGERIFDLVLRLGGEEVQTSSDLARLPLVTRHGTLVPLAMAASVADERTVVQISREQMRRRLLVQANVRGRDIVGFVNEAQSEVAKIAFPRSVEVQWGGQFQNFNRAKSRLMVLVPVALGIIALLLVVTFRGARYMVVTLLNLPFAVAGGVFALVLRGLPFSIPAGVGFIALAGVSVTAGIVMTTSLLATSAHRGAVERVYEASLASFRAPLATALVAAVGFVPAAIATGTGAEVQRPLATVVIGGLLFSTVVSLLALPVMLRIALERESRNGAE